VYFLKKNGNQFKKKHPTIAQRRTRELFLCFLTSFIPVIEYAERTAPDAPFITGLSMDGNICPRELNFQLGFKVIGKIVRLQHRDRTGHDKVELDKDFRT
jgi:hypothetical protein